MSAFSVQRGLEVQRMKLQGARFDASALSQRLQYPLIEEYTLILIRVPIII